MAGSLNAICLKRGQQFGHSMSRSPDAEASDRMGQSREALPKVERLPGENQRDRVLSLDEEKRYLEATVLVGEGILVAYRAALQGISGAPTV